MSVRDLSERTHTTASTRSPRGPSHARRDGTGRDVSGVSATSQPASPGVQPVADLSIAPSAPDTVEAVAIVRDYTDPSGCWREVPVSELGIAA